jgi:hypothetical protein
MLCMLAVNKGYTHFFLAVVAFVVKFQIEAIEKEILF